MRSRHLCAVILMAVLALGAGGCSTVGGAPAEPPSATAPVVPTRGEVTFVGFDNLQWEEQVKEAVLVGGALEVTIECRGGVPHNVALEGVQDDAILAECGGNDVGTGTLRVEPGTYTYYCVVPGHRTAGMEGVITIS